MSSDDWAHAPDANLPGGYIKAVVRIGDTVHRPPGANAEFVHQLLQHLEACGFEAAPLFLGFDEQGREVLSYIEGHVAWDSQQPPGVWSDASLIDVARLTRRLHDLTAGTALAGDRPVVCHNDLSPKNTVYRDCGEGYRPVAFIDWDAARPGLPEDDLAYLFWQFLSPGKSHPDTGIHVRRMHAMLDAYGYSGARLRLVGRMEGCMQGAIDGIREQADAGDAAHERLLRMGALDDIGSELEWLRQNRAAMEAGLASKP